MSYLLYGQPGGGYNQQTRTKTQQLWGDLDLSEEIYNIATFEYIATKDDKSLMEILRKQYPELLGEESQEKKVPFYYGDNPEDAHKYYIRFINDFLSIIRITNGMPTQDYYQVGKKFLFPDFTLPDLPFFGKNEFELFVTLGTFHFRVVLSLITSDYEYKQVPVVILNEEVLTKLLALKHLDDTKDWLSMLFGFLVVASFKSTKDFDDGYNKFRFPGEIDLRSHSFFDVSRRPNVVECLAFLRALLNADSPIFLPKLNHFLLRSFHILEGDPLRGAFQPLVDFALSEFFKTYLPILIEVEADPNYYAYNTSSIAQFAKEMAEKEKGFQDYEDTEHLNYDSWVDLAKNINERVISGLITVLFDLLLKGVAMALENDYLLILEYGKDEANVITFERDEPDAVKKILSYRRLLGINIVRESSLALPLLGEIYKGKIENSQNDAKTLVDVIYKILPVSNYAKGTGPVFKKYMEKIFVQNNKLAYWEKADKIKDNWEKIMYDPKGDNLKDLYTHSTYGELRVWIHNLLEGVSGS